MPSKWELVKKEFRFIKQTNLSFIDAQNDVIRRTQQAQAALGQQGELTMPYFISEFKEGYTQPGTGAGGKLETLNPDTEQNLKLKKFLMKMH